jgi:hypothetical protein
MGFDGSPGKLGYNQESLSRKETRRMRKRVTVTEKPFDLRITKEVKESQKTRRFSPR